MSPFLGYNNPAFDPGEVWKPADGSAYRVKILSVVRWEQGETEWDYTVYYTDGKTEWSKELWSFQVRWEHDEDGKD